MTQHDDEREAPMRPACPRCGSNSFRQFDEEPLGECLMCGESYFLGLPYINLDALADPPTPADYELADLILTAGFRRTPTITEEMIERAAKAGYEEDVNLHFDDELVTVWWDDLSDSGRDLERRRARAALTAALGDGDE